MTFTPQVLAEALTDPDVKKALSGIVEAAVEERASEIRSAARADADRAIRLRDMRDAAASQIAEAKLPPEFAAVALGRFALTEAGPSDGLDVDDVVDAEGKVAKRAEAVLKEAVEAEITHQRALVASLQPTRVRGQGVKTPPEGKPAGKEGEVTEGAQDAHLGPLTASLLQEAGISDPDKVYALS